MSSSLPNDKKFAELMKKSRLEIPYSDFDENVMRRIKEEVIFKKSFLKEINASIFFVFIGMLIGIAASFLLPGLLNNSLFTPSREIIQIIQAVLIMLVLTQLEGLIKLMRKYWKTIRTQNQVGPGGSH